MPLNLGIIGLGLIAHDRVIPAALASNRIRITALSDVNPSMIERAARLTGVRNIHTDYHDLLARDDVDLVYIATPNFLHAQQAIDCVRAKRHVLCEKPMACTVAEGEAMVRAAKENGVLLAIDYMTRFSAVLREARRLIQENAFGQVYLARSHFSYRKPGGQSEFRLAAERQGGGPLADVGVYSLDMIRYVLGQEVAEAHGVLGRVRPGWNVHDSAALALKLTNGVPAYVDATFDFSESGFELICEKGILIGRSCFSQLPYGTLAIAKSLGDDGDREILVDVRPEHLPHYDMYRQHLEYLADCIEKGVAPMTSGEIGVRDLRVLETVYHQNAVPIDL